VGARGSGTAKPCQEEGRPSTVATMAANNAELDPSSSEFNAKKAIYTRRIDGDEGVCYDSVEQCISAIYNKDKKRENAKKDRKEPEKLERKFLPEQMPVPVIRKEFRHVLTRMDEFKEGPLATLREWMLEKAKVKVLTRGLNQIRGFAIGYIQGFDKHWNLALSDVDEHFNRARRRKTFSTDSQCRRKLVPSDLPVEMRVGSSVMRILRIQGKYEVCVRHVPQVLLRGEHVVMVAKIPD